jgi:hypothetical protein
MNNRNQTKTTSPLLAQHLERLGDQFVHDLWDYRFSAAEHLESELVQFQLERKDRRGSDVPRTSAGVGGAPLNSAC